MSYFGGADRFTDRKKGPQGTGLFEKPVDPYAQYHKDPTKHEDPRERLTKPEFKQEPKVCPNKISGRCMMPDPICGYPYCEK